MTELEDAVDGAEGIVNDGARRRFADLRAEWARHRDSLARLLDEGLGGFNRLLRERGVPAVFVQQP